MADSYFSSLQIYFGIYNYMYYMYYTYVFQHNTCNMYIQNKRNVKKPFLK